MAAAILSVLYSSGENAEVPLCFGNNVLGRQGGPADVGLDAQSLSKRHAMITVGERAEECTIEDLGSTNKTAFVESSEALTTLEPGHVYPLVDGIQLVLGDVNVMFYHLGSSAPSSIPSTGHRDRNVMFVKTPQSRSSAKSNPSNAGWGNMSVTQLQDQGYGRQLSSKLVYEHGRAELGMNLPYDSALIWVAETSLQMPLPEGWAEDKDSGLFVNRELGVRTTERPQTIICRNLYEEMRRKAQMEESLGTIFADEALPRLLVLHAATQISLFHYILPGRNVIGKAKSGADIVLSSTALSKRHGYVELRQGRVFAGDLGSTNGTFVGEYPHPDSTRLDPGVEMEVYDGQLLFFADVECTLSVPSGGSIVRALTAGAAASLADDDSVDVPPPPPQGARRDGGRFGADVDYDEIRKIIREEVANAAGYVRELQRQDGKERESPGKSPVRSALRGSARGGGGSRYLDDGEETGGSLGEGSLDGSLGEEGSREYPAAQVDYDVEEEVRLAEEMADLEAMVAENVDDARAEGGQQKAEVVNSRKKGFLARQEARKLQMMEWAKGFYRKQSPYDELGKHLLPTGALHRILQNLDTVPHLCVLSTVCHSLRRAASVTKPWKTVNGDQYGNLWGVVKLSGTRCADGHTLLSGLGPERLGSVVVMDLSGINTITDDTLAVLAEQCANLQHLSLKCRVDIGPQITDVGLEDVAACCPKLRSLSLSWCTKVTDFALHAVAKGCRDLEALDISFCNQITDDGLLAVLQQCEKIETLRLESCDVISEHGIVAISQFAPRLKTLSIAGCLKGATTLSVIQIARECPMLTHMDLTGVSGLEDAAVWQMSRGCRWIRELLLAWCVQLSDQSFSQIASNCPLLTNLSLRGCTKLSDAAVVQLAQNCCYLQELDIRGCDAVSQGGMDALAVMVPSCIVHFLDKSYNKDGSRK